MKIIFTVFSRGNVLHRSKGELENVENSVVHYTLQLRLHFFSIDDRLCVERKDDRSYASVNSSSALHTRELIIFFKKKRANSQGCLNAPRRARRKKANAPPPGSSLSNTSAVLFINQGLKRSTVQYFNATVLKTSRTTVRFS